MTVSFSLHGHRVVFELPDPSDLIQRKISERQSFYELDLLEDMRRRLHPGGLCVDVGAHLGNHTIYLAKICGMQVLAFEPQPELYRLLLRNVELNGVQDRVRAFNVALGASAGRGILRWPRSDNTGAARLELAADGEVEVSTLDDHVVGERVDLIKVDVEGFEVQVLEGARRTLERDHPLVYAEAMDAAARAALQTYLDPLGYVAGAAFASTPVIAYEHCVDEHSRLAAFTAHVESAQAELGASLRQHQREANRELRAMVRAVDHRVEALERAVAELRDRDLAAVTDALARVAARGDDQTAMLYELLSLGMQTYSRLRAGSDAPAYQPLNDAAARLRDWKPSRKRWTVPKGTGADAYLQGYTGMVAAAPGDLIDVHASTDRPALFAKLRVFGLAHRRQRELAELYCSPALAIPDTGVGATAGDERAWRVVHSVRTGKRWLPGCYVARLETVDGSATVHPFWLTSRAPASRALRLCPTITHYLRNKWPGAPAASRLWRGRGRHESVRFPRPFAGARGGEALRYELPVQQWASANGVDLDCLTDLQVHRDPSLLTPYEQVVIAGDCRYLTREIVDALAAFKARGGSIAVLGAAPGEHEVELDLDARTLTEVRQPAARRARWRDDVAALWRATRSTGHERDPLDLSVTAHGRADLNASATLPGVVAGRLSATDLPDDDPVLVARTRAGRERCDATLERTPAGGKVFVAGTDGWTLALDRPEVAAVTARLLGAPVADGAWQPLVSVIMTAYDSAAYVARAVESILAQSYANLELIVVDDDSSDDTFDVLLELARRDPRVRPFKSFRNAGTYWCKDYGITRARGELITFQDSDDTSLPSRLAEQVEALHRRPDAVASMVDYERRNAAGELLSNRGVTQRTCFPSLMIRAAEVVERIGFFDCVRTSADQEYLHRLRLVFGADRVVQIRKPLYQALVRDGSLTTSAGNEVALEADAASHLSENRQRYVEAYRAWHERIERGDADPRVPFPQRARPFEAPAAMLMDGDMAPPAPPRAERERALAELAGRAVRAADGAELQLASEPLPDAPDDWRRIVGVVRPDDDPAATAPGVEFDVILMSDFRFPGGTSQSNAAEITAQARAGLTTGLIQTPSPVLKRDRPFHAAIQRLIDDGSAQLLPAGATARCRLLVIRHPSVLERELDALPRVRADHVVVIVNQAPVDEASGRVIYDMERCQDRARQRYGSPGTWFPIGPLVRKAVERLPGAEHLAPTDWENVIDVDDWAAPRTGFVADVPVIGRHARDTPDKWPPDRDTILAAYPDRGVKVRILGGAAPVADVLGAFPANWEVLPFGAQGPREFLQTIDFLVYFHHPSLVEAFGRTILEALAAGVPAIVPHHFAALFEDVPLYAEPAEVADLIAALYRDRAAYEQRARAGVELVRRRFSYAAHVDRVRRLIRPAPRAGADTVQLEADSVYKLGFVLDGTTQVTRARLRAVDRDTGQQLLELPVEGARAELSEFVVTGDRPVQLDVVVEVDAGPALALTRVRARRRAERPRQPSLQLTDASVTAALATYPARRDIVPAVIESLAPQVDRLFVYLNNYDDVPAFVRDSPHRDRIAFILDPTSQLRAAAKFHWLDTIRGYHLVCDDDILYPPDYAERMVAAIERHGRRAIVGVHGVIFQPELVDARTSRRQVFKFPDALAEDAPVHFLGTGTVALHASVLPRMDLSKLRAFPIANDEILAVSAKRAGVPMVCVARGAHWLAPHDGVEFGIFEERQIDGAEHARATELLASANPWPAPTAVP